MLPTVLVGLLTADPSADNYFEEVEQLVRSDPAFAARLLRYANSPAFAAPKPIVRVHDALVRLGCATAVNLILAVSATRVFVPRQGWARELWGHALDVAALARHLAQGVSAVRVDPEVAYMSGLLHDIGRFVLYLEAPDEIRRIDERDWETPAALVALEQEMCGFTHANLGASVAAKWGIPETVVRLIQHHHDTPPPESAPELAERIRLIRIADWIDVTVRHQGGCKAMDDEALRASLRAIPPLDTAAVDEQLLRLVRRALEDAEQSRAAVGI